MKPLETAIQSGRAVYLRPELQEVWRRASSSPWPKASPTGWNDTTRKAKPAAHSHLTRTQARAFITHKKLRQPAQDADRRGFLSTMKRARVHKSEARLFHQLARVEKHNACQQTGGAISQPKKSVIANAGEAISCSSIRAAMTSLGSSTSVGYRNDNPGTQDNHISQIRLSI